MKTNKRERLIIFTRYPEPGKTKTRMIPALGPEGAASLQRKMTEYTLHQALKLENTTSLSLQIHYAGGELQLMENWLGSQLVYRPQEEGDLGHRMLAAFTNSFAENMTAVVIIGIDCPGINPAILTEAFTALQHQDLVLGPALDGGYYLIGLSRLVPQLFADISWGTGTVFARTSEIAKGLGLSCSVLEPLADIDRPEDLNDEQLTINN